MFPETERLIFPLRRGGADSHADPMTVWRNLYEALEGQELEPILQQAGEKDPRVRLDALGRLARLARAAFGLQPLAPDGQTGDTESHAIATLYRFFTWENELKKASGSTPSGSPPSECSPDRSTT